MAIQGAIHGAGMSTISAFLGGQIRGPLRLQFSPFVWGQMRGHIRLQHRPLFWGNSEGRSRKIKHVFGPASGCHRNWMSQELLGKANKVWPLLQQHWPISFHSSPFPVLY